MALAYGTTFWYDNFSVWYRIFSISTFKLMEKVQLYLVIACGLGAFYFLIRKWILKPKSSKGNNCGPNCGCH